MLRSNPAADLRRALDELPLGSTIGDFFSTLRGFLPLRAGFVDCFPERAPESGVLVPFELPKPALDAIMCSRFEDAPRVLRIVAAAPCGSFLRDRDVTMLIDWSSVAGYRCLAENSLAEVAAVKVRAAPLAGDHEHTYIALFQESGAPSLDRAHAALLRECWRDLGQTLARLRVPILAQEPLLLQITSEKNLGLACVTDYGRYVESNGRAALLAREYRSPDAASIDALGSFLTSLERDLDPTLDAAVVQVAHARAPRVLRATRHFLRHTRYGLGGGARLWVLDEIEMTPIDARLQRLSPRLRDVARWLVFTGLASRDVAIALGVSQSTLSNHTSRLYQKLRVSSRSELTESLLGKR